MATLRRGGGRDKGGWWVGEPRHAKTVAAGPNFQSGAVAHAIGMARGATPSTDFCTFKRQHIDVANEPSQTRVILSGAEAERRAQRSRRIPRIHERYRIPSPGFLRQAQDRLFDSVPSRLRPDGTPLRMTRVLGRFIAAASKTCFVNASEGSPGPFSRHAIFLIFSVASGSSCRYRSVITK